MLKNTPKIEDSFEKLDNYPNVIQRYYKQFYFLHNQATEQEHHCVLAHSNKICIIALAPTHPIVKKKKKIINLDFQVTNKVDRLDNKVSGKGKKGGQHIVPDSALCFVNCADGSKYTIWGCIKGKLVEINQSLLKNPNIIIDEPLSKGFIAILLPSLKDFETYKSKLITHKRYEEELANVP